MSTRPRRTSIRPGNVLVPVSCPQAITDRQEDALAAVREKLMGRREACSALILSSSTLSRTIMVSQMKSRGWTTQPANHLSDATAIIHQQIQRAQARGLSVARDINPQEIQTQYSSSGFRIKYAEEDAVTRLVIVDCFIHEQLEDIVKHLRLLDAEHSLQLIIAFLTSPRPTDGLGFVLSPARMVSLSEAYECGVDLVIPTFFDRSVVEFLTEVFLSSSGRYLKRGTTNGTSSNFSQIRALLMDVTDRHQGISLHATDDHTGGVPNLTEFAATGKTGLDEDQLEQEVQNAKSREASRSEKRRVGQRAAADAIDTNPEYISLLSKYEVALRQLQADKGKIDELSEGLENSKAALTKSESETQTARVEVARLEQMLTALQNQEEQSLKQRQATTSQNQYTQLVQREQRIQQLEKEVAGYKAKLENTKKLADDAISKVEKFKRESDEAKRALMNVTKRFETRLRAFGMTNPSQDLDDDKQQDGVELLTKLQTDNGKLRQRQLVWQQRLEASERQLAQHHDHDGYGRSAEAIIGGFHALMSKEEMYQLMQSKRGPFSTISTSFSAPAASNGSNVSNGLSPVPLQANQDGGVKKDMSIISLNSDDEEGGAEKSSGADDKPDGSGDEQNFGGSLCEGRSTVSPPPPHVDTTLDKLLSEFGGMSDEQFRDLTGVVVTNEYDEASAACDALVLEARRAVQEGERVVSEVRKLHRESEESRRYGGVRSGIVPERFLAAVQNRRVRGATSPISPVTQSLTEAAFAAVQETNQLQAQATVTSLGSARDLITAELEAFATSVETAEKTEMEHRQQIIQTLSDYVQLANRYPTSEYRNVLSKVETYLTHKLSTAQKQVEMSFSFPEALERHVTELARLKVLHKDLQERKAALNQVTDSGSPAVQRLTELELRLEVIEARALKQLPDMISTRKIDAYLETQQEIFSIRREMRTLPGGQAKASRASKAPQLLLSAAAAFATATGSSAPASHSGKAPQDPHFSDVLSVTDVAEKGLIAELQLRQTSSRQYASELRRRSNVIAIGVKRLKSVGQDVSENKEEAVSEAGQQQQQQFRSHSIVALTDGNSEDTSGSTGATISMKQFVGNLKQAVRSKFERAQTEIQHATEHVTDSVGALVTNTNSFSDLDFREVESLLAKTRDLITPTALYQICLLYHKDVVRLLRQLRKRTSLTAVNIIDAHQLQRQLLKDGRELTKAQADNIPFILAVDAAQVARFAEYFEKETDALVKEGVARLQRHVEDAAAKELGLGDGFRRSGGLGSSHGVDSSGEGRLTTSNKGSHLPVKHTVKHAAGGARSDSPDIVNLDDEDDHAVGESNSADLKHTSAEHIAAGSHRPNPLSDGEVAAITRQRHGHHLGEKNDEHAAGSRTVSPHVLHIKSSHMPSNSKAAVHHTVSANGGGSAVIVGDDVQHQEEKPHLHLGNVNTPPTAIMGTAAAMTTAITSTSAAHRHPVPVAPPLLPPSDAVLSTPRPTEEAIRASTAQLLFRYEEMRQTANNSRSGFLGHMKISPRSHDKPHTHSTMLFGASQVSDGSAVDPLTVDLVDQRVVYVPRTPATDTRGSTVARRLLHSNAASTLQTQKPLMSVIEHLVGPSSSSPPNATVVAFRPMLPFFAPTLPPPSRQKSALQL